MSTSTAPPEPSSLAELQGLATDELRAVESYQYQGTASPKRLIEAIIRLASAEVSWQGEANAESLRGFWYNPVKPIVETAFPEKLDDPSYKFGRRMSQYLSDVLSELVQDGELTYRDLNILDDSRQRALHTDSIEDDKILFVEKDAAYRKLKPLADVYKLSVVSGSGWQATALIEDLARALDGDRDYQLFVVSDYDPTGFRIVEDFGARASRLGIGVETVERVAISPDQVGENALHNQRFSPPVENDYDERWMVEHGIDGGYGLEIEAVGGLETGGRALRDLVVDALRPHIRERRRYGAGLDSTAGVAAEDAVDDVLDDLTNDLEVALRDAAVEVLADRGAVARAEQRDNTPPWSDRDREPGQIQVSVDADSLILPEDADDETVEDATDKYLPAPIQEGALHEHAADGETFTYRVGHAERALREELERRLNNGEIDVTELLGGGSS
jgi:hypothetical protein